MESFYGGKQGASFVIKAAFEYVNEDDPGYISALYEISRMPESTEEEKLAKIAAQTALTNSTMIKCFSNPNYKDVWYGEYCIIDSANKNNANNGKIYRRTLKKVSDEVKDVETGGYADYIGQVVGPAGPPIMMGGIFSTDYVESKFDSTDILLGDSVDFIDAETGEHKDSKDADSDILINDFSNNGIRFIPGNTLASTATENDIPSQYFKNGENQEAYIHHGGYNWYYTRLQRDNDETRLYIGFDIPYHVIDIDTTVESLDFNQPGEVTPESLGQFYTRYKFKVPRGIQGGYFGNIHVETITDKYFCYSVDDIEYVTKGENEEPIPGYYALKKNASSIQTLNEGQKAWICYFYFYDTEGNLKTLVDTDDNPVKFFLGKYKEIKDIELNRDGRLEFSYTDDTETKIFDQVIKTGIYVSGEDLSLDVSNSSGVLDPDKALQDLLNETDEDDEYLYDHSRAHVVNYTYNNAEGELIENEPRIYYYDSVSKKWRLLGAMENVAIEFEADTINKTEKLSTPWWPII